MNEAQPELFSWKPYKGEPPAQSHSETSKAAADSIKKAIGPLHEKVLAYLEAHPDGATDEEMTNAIPMVANTLRPRRRELELLGKIKDSGRRGLTQSGRSAVVWIKA